MTRHILFLTHYFPPEVNAPASRTYEHAKYWIKKGIRVTVITNHPNHPEGRLFPNYANRWITREKIDDIDVVRVKTYLTPNKGHLRRSFNYLLYSILAIWHSKWIADYDLLVATSPQILCGLAGVVIKKLRRRPLVLEVRDLWPDSILAVKVLKEGFLIKALRIIEMIMYRSATEIVTVTAAFKHHIRAMGIPASRIHVVPNGVDVGFFLSKSTETSEILHLLPQGDKVIFSYIGTIGIAHNLETILHALKNLIVIPEIHCLLIGSGARKESLRFLKEKMGLENVTILPLQPKHLIPKFVQASDVGIVILSNSHLFSTVLPSKMFEYMALRKPIIVAVPMGEATSIVNRYECGVCVAPGDPPALAKVMEWLYHHKAEREVMGENGFRAVLQDYSREKLADQMLNAVELAASR